MANFLESTKIDGLINEQTTPLFYCSELELELELELEVRRFIITKKLNFVP